MDEADENRNYATEVISLRAGRRQVWGSVEGFGTGGGFRQRLLSLSAISPLAFSSCAPIPAPHRSHSHPNSSPPLLPSSIPHQLSLFLVPCARSFDHSLQSFLLCSSCSYRSPSSLLLRPLSRSRTFDAQFVASFRNLFGQCGPVSFGIWRRIGDCVQSACED